MGWIPITNDTINLVKENKYIKYKVGLKWVEQKISKEEVKLKCMFGKEDTGMYPLIPLNNNHKNFILE